ncbi:AAEL002032-PA [Aedes aegypti]|uniref:AAEL002032-PA n=1 Tax=Aedes aegypti TaxID=7159 RepID=Q17JL6_AEDAE|nr:AAEL002032-PA [Aedes aegypti]
MTQGIYCGPNLALKSFPATDWVKLRLNTRCPTVNVADLIDQINGLRKCWTDPKSLPKVVSQNTTTIQIRSNHNRNRVNVCRQHCYATVFPSVTKEDIKFPFFIPRG